MTTDLEGKVILVTGATEGIGKAAALDFAARGATVTITARSRDKGERVLAELAAASGGSTQGDRHELLVGDLSVLSDMRAVADAFRARHDRLDVLVNNAGAVFMDYELTADGIERTFALNHLGYFVLTTRLLDLIEKTPGARVVSTSSGAHQMGKLDLTTIVKRDGRAGFRAYSDSKLANILFTRALAKRLEPSGATANCLHPGFVRSGFGHNNSGPLSLFLRVISPIFARTPEKGAETLIWLATSPDAAHLRGEYVHDRSIAGISERARDDALAEALWKLSEEIDRRGADAAS